MSRETDSIYRSIANLELTIDDLSAQRAQVQRYLEELETARAAIGNSRVSFFEKLAGKRSTITSMSSVTNAAVAQAACSHMQATYGSTFESNVDANYSGITNDIDANIQAAHDRIGDLDTQIRDAQDSLDRAQAELRMQMAREAARGAAEGAV